MVLFGFGVLLVAGPALAADGLGWALAYVLVAITYAFFLRRAWIKTVASADSEGGRKVPFGQRREVVRLVAESDPVNLVLPQDLTEVPGFGIGGALEGKLIFVRSAAGLELVLSDDEENVQHEMEQFDSRSQLEARLRDSSILWLSGTRAGGTIRQRFNHSK